MRAPDAPAADAAPVLRLTRLIPAPRDKVFAAWTESATMRQWYCPPGLTCQLAESDPRVGGRYRVHMRSSDGRIHKVGGVYREVKPPERLTFTWTWEPEKNEIAGVETVVAIEFEDRGGQTWLVMTHSGLPTDTARDKHASGWTGCLDNLVRFLESEPPRTGSS